MNKQTKTRTIATHHAIRGGLFAVRVLHAVDGERLGFDTNSIVLGVSGRPYTLYGARSAGYHSFDSR